MLAAHARPAIRPNAQDVLREAGVPVTAIGRLASSVAAPGRSAAAASISSNGGISIVVGAILERMALA
jgi:hypothetical protein